MRSVPPSSSPPLEIALRTTTGHQVSAHTARGSLGEGIALHFRGGMWSAEFSEPEAVRLRDWLLKHYPLQPIAPPRKTAVELRSAERAARAEAWARSQEPLLKRLWWGDLSQVEKVDWNNVLRAVRRVGGLDAADQ